MDQSNLKLAGEGLISEQEAKELEKQEAKRLRLELETPPISQNRIDQIKTRLKAINRLGKSPD